MATQAEIMQALRAAHEAGDEEAARRFAQMYQAAGDSESKKIEAVDMKSSLPVGNRFLMGVGNAVVEDAMGLGQLVGLVNRADVDAQKAKFNDLRDDTAFNVGGVTGKVADVLIPGGALKNFGGYIPKVGNALSKVGEMVSMPKGFLDAVGGGAILGATQPVGTDDSRIANTALSAAAGGALPGAFKLIGGGANFAKQHMPTNSALRQIQEIFDGNVPLSAPSIVRQAPDDAFIGPETPKYFYTPGVEPTTAMLTENPAFRKLEQNARVRNPGKFEASDNANNRAVYEALASKALPDNQANALQDALNAETGQLRGEAFDAANRNPDMINPVMDWIMNQSEKPGIRNSSAMTVLNKANKQTSMPDVQAEDLYTLRKEFGDMLNPKGLAVDEMTNAARNNRRLISELNGIMDDTLDSASAGKWREYLATHSEGMKPIEEGRAFQDILDKFESSRTVGGAPVITPAKLRNAVNNETYKNLGKTGYVDVLSDEGRKVADSAVEVMNDIERARAGVRGVDGSQTTPLATSLLSSAMPKGGLLGSAIDWAKSAGIRTANGLLDDAAFDPVLMQKLLDKYHNVGLVQPYKLPPAIPYLSAGSAAGVPYILQQ